ncbi:hypothetical protein EWM64_g3942 [Hericium alpestre]|uniref:AB hydrolase-1 domain-containing protein n=1 Tax=Hericium alpestre TaxID=135208 RepID=A0A4Z0A013_9AGAM|nr:hypothetical protein EWM64_g3942 [Hericium alpestre]
MSTELRQRTTNGAASVNSGVVDPVDVPLNLPTIFDPVSLTRKGLCPVTKIRHQEEPLESHSLYFEQHGTGPEKVVFIMGLNSSSFSWAPQVAHFGRDPQYSILVFDNRGVGNSGTPRGPYSTSGMAEDVVALLDYIGWTNERDLHVVGISLGGMIAQELAAHIPERIVSLTLAVTTPGGYPWNNTPPLKGTLSLARLTFTADVEKKLPTVLEMVMPTPWLHAKAENDPEGRTNFEIQKEHYRRRILSTRPQKLIGTFSQMYAALGHYVSPERLARISSSIPKVLILTGDEDNLVRTSNSHYLKANMPEAELVVWEQTGHALHIQRQEMFNKLLERVFAEGREKSQQA